MPPHLRGIVLIAVAAVFAAEQMWWVLDAPAVGIDFTPLRHAATALTAGASVYGDRAFVYPPTAAVALLPLTLGSEGIAFQWWAALNVAALALTAALICRATAPDRRLYLVAAALVTLFGSAVTGRSLFAGNLTGLLVPVAVAVLLAFHRGRWVAGCALLAASLLVKPLLAPLLLVPVLRRRWRALTITMVPGGTLLLVGLAVVPGGSHYPAVLRYCLAGTNLHGANAFNNLSLRGWVEAHHLSPTLGTAAALVALLAVVTRITRAIRITGPAPDGNDASPAWLGGTLLLGTMLAGTIAELNYLPVVQATVLLHLALHRPGPRTVLRHLPGLAVLGLPGAYHLLIFGAGPDWQSWFVCGELLVLAALLAEPVHRPADPVTPVAAVPVPAVGVRPATEASGR